MRETGHNPERLTDEAIDLMIRWQNDPTNPTASEMIRTWRARGIEHEQAWTKVARIHGAAGKVLMGHDERERYGSPGVTRRRLVIAGPIALGAAGAGSSFLPEILNRARADHLTGKGEIRRIGLTDGTIATLGPDSMLAVDFRTTSRRVTLLAGMAFFEVALDEKRPFSVLTENILATIMGAFLGTAFDVSSDAGFVTVSVERGDVEAHETAATSSVDGRLGEGDWLTFDGASHLIERGRRDRSQIAPWRDRYIVAEMETVSALVARVGRWIPGRIVMAHPFIGTQRVSGIFDLRDPMSALKAVVHPAGGHIRQATSLVTVISPI